MLSSFKSLQPAGSYQALIFDCDGTLANTLPIHLQAWQQALQLFGVGIDDNWFHEHRGVSSGELIDLLQKKHNKQFDLLQLHKVRKGYFAEAVKSVTEMTPVANIARAHAGQVPMAVASGGSRDMVEATLQTLGLQALFQITLTREDVMYGKPAPDLFLLAAKRLQIAPDKCVVYEDSEQGLQAAAAAGMQAIDVRLFC